MQGRLTRIQDTTRPGDIWLEFWQSYGLAQKRKAIAAWIPKSKLRNEKRSKRGVHDIPDAMVKEYHRTLMETRSKVGGPPAPAMHLMEKNPIQSDGGNSSLTLATHSETVADIGDVSDDYYVLVHKPVSMKDVARISFAKDVVNDE